LFEFSRFKIPECAVPDMENPNYLALLVHFVKDSIDAAPFAEQKAANLPLGFQSFAGQLGSARVAGPGNAVHQSASRTTRGLEAGLDR
jgi:hypothetical protein